MPVYRDLWGPQQQVARRHAIEQTSVTLGTPDFDPTVVIDEWWVRGNPYQLRWRDPTISAVQTNIQWQRKRFSTNELGSVDQADTGYPNTSAGRINTGRQTYRAVEQPVAVNATQQWLRRRRSTNELGTTDSDPTIRPLWAASSAYLRPTPRQPDAITTIDAWIRNRQLAPECLLQNSSVENGTGTPDFWTSLGGAGATWSTAEAHTGTHSLRLQSSASDSWASAYFAVTAGQSYVLSAWIKGTTTLGAGFFKVFWSSDGISADLGNNGFALDASYPNWTQLSLVVVAPAGARYAFVQPSSDAFPHDFYTDDFCLTLNADADPTVQQPYQDPWQLRSPDPAFRAVNTWEQWFRKTLNSNDLGTGDQDPTIRPAYQDPWQRRSPDPARLAVESWLAWARLRANTNTLGLADSDPTVRPGYQDPYQRRRVDPATAIIEAFEQWFRKTLNSNDIGTTDADPTVKPPYQDPHQRRHADPATWSVQTFEAWMRLRLTTNDLGLPDADPTVVTPWEYTHPFSLYWRDTAVTAVTSRLATWRPYPPDSGGVIPPPPPPPEVLTPGSRNRYEEAYRRRLRRDDDEILFLT